MIKPVEWKETYVKVLDQTLLPEEGTDLSDGLGKQFYQKLQEVEEGGKGEGV